MHIEFVPDFCEGTDLRPLSHPVSHLVGGRAGDTARRIYDELLHIDSASGIAFEGLALVLLAETLREVSRESSVPRWLRRVQERLHEEAVAIPSLKQIAADVGVHPTYLAASFQQHFGMGAGEYVRARRIEQARTMLASSERSLSEIALLLGFADQSHFGRTFKQQTGFSPREYRRLFTGHPNPLPES